MATSEIVAGFRKGCEGMGKKRLVHVQAGQLLELCSAHDAQAARIAELEKQLGASDEPTDLDEQS